MATETGFEDTNGSGILGDTVAVADVFTVTDPAGWYVIEVSKKSRHYREIIDPKVNHPDLLIPDEISADDCVLQNLDTDGDGVNDYEDAFPLDFDNDGFTDAAEVAAGSDPTNPLSTPLDVDGDGFPAVGDCDDTNAAVYPGATETLGDGIDSNCDGSDNT